MPAIGSPSWMMDGSHPLRLRPSSQPMTVTFVTPCGSPTCTPGPVPPANLAARRAKREQINRNAGGHEIRRSPSPTPGLAVYLHVDGRPRPLGVRLIDRVHLECGVDVASALRAAGVRPVAGGLERPRTTRTFRGRIRLLIPELVPTRSFMRT